MSVSIVYLQDPCGFCVLVDGAVSIRQTIDSDGRTPLTPDRAQVLAEALATELQAAQPQTAPTPELVITSLVVDAPGWAEGTSEATLKKGTTAKATGELRLSGVKIPFSATFRMPIQANDGRERLILATLTEGALSVEWTPTESGTWAVSQEAINRGLPPEDRMTFAGLRLLVLD
jgi:hypothetical protein